MKENIKAIFLLTVNRYFFHLSQQDFEEILEKSGERVKERMCECLCLGVD